jgi:hypothetical protein
MKKLVLLFICISIYSCKVVEKPYSIEMKQELKRMYKEDQDSQNALRTSFMEKKDRKITDSINKRIKVIFKDNYKTVKNYFETNGYPNIKSNDKFTSFAFWIIVQHCDHDVQFQNSVLKSMKKYVKSKDVNLENYAYLYDRVNKNLGKEQLYGTQVYTDSLGVYYLYKTKDISDVNKRRKEFNIKNTVEEYLNGFKRN